VLLAAVTHRWIERPCRLRRGITPTWKQASPILMTVPALLLASFLVIWGDGFPNRFSPRTQRLAHAFQRLSHGPHTRNRNAFDTNDLSLQHPTCVIWGDSFAGMWRDAFEAAANKHDVNLVRFGTLATPPILGFAKYRPGLDNSYEETKNGYVDYMRREKPDLVILSGMWESAHKRQGFEKQLRFTLQTLHDAGLRVAVMLPPPLQDCPVARTLALHSAYGHPARPSGKSWAKYQKRPAIKALYRACDGLAEILDPGPYFVNPQGIWPVETREGSMYSDHCHVSQIGSLRATPLFDKLFATLGETANSTTDTDSESKPEMNPE